MSELMPGAAGAMSGHRAGLGVLSEQGPLAAS